ncbi:uncharacterized protein LOC144172641 isoform X1 [Haemaphysalis longicornis]
MVKCCAVPQCKSTAFTPAVSLHRFPQHKTQRKVWISKVKLRRKISKYDSVCSRHFTAECFTHNNTDGKAVKRPRLKKTALPSENLPLGSHDRLRKPRKLPKDRTLCAAHKESPPSSEDAVHQGSSGNREFVPAVPAEATPSTSADGSSTATLTDHDSEVTISCDHDEFIDDDEDCSGANNDFWEVLQQQGLATCSPAPLPESNCVGVQADPISHEQTKPLLSFDIIRTDKQMAVVTGVGCICLVQNIANEFQAVRSKMSRRDFALAAEETVLLVLIKLYHNLSVSFLAFLFKLHRTTVSKLFKTSVCILAHILGDAIFFPEDESLADNLTHYFKKYPRTKLILDCTEIPLQRPKDTTSRILTFSHYKRTYTGKLLVGCAPSGMIVFLSKCYGGKASDTFLTKESTVLSRCFQGDQVMVDKGFLIEKLCTERGVELVRPPFLQKKRQMSAYDASKTHEIARARVHVERAIQRLKAFKIFQGHFPVHLFPVLDDIVKLLGGIINLSPAIFANQRFLRS